MAMNWEPDDTGGLMGDAAQLSMHDESGQLPDHELVERVIEGRQEAYKVLVERYQGRIFRVAFGLMRNREDAREVTQEAFIKAYRNLPNFRRDSSFYTWIYRITVNLGIDQKRKAYRSRETPLDEGRLSVEEAHHTGPRPLPGPRQNLHRKELAGRIGEAIASLPDDQKLVIVLREVQGLSYKEIADQTGIAEGTVMSRLFYARKKLQGLLKDLR
jgi:RNA polymerase sigma-70 factor, ECF subfamily